ncbi:MAG: dimethyl sulfoxide reductase anchor subunit [Desulfovibrio sp.]|jgi:anaerobic dimethyl sulfoxide reductase subunit C (anchor subunit)|nr:dimethyl sulfoxide reductase anchor subunit [Desulfovibrio sp.]
MPLLHEWSLVLFTALAQVAVGIVLVGECLLHAAQDAAVRTNIRRQSPIAFALFVVAVLISLGHTGSPLNSFNTIRNIGSSWLSREIGMLCLTGIVFLWLAFMRMKEQEQAQEKTAAGLVVVFGVLLVVTMSQVYRLPVAPVWDSCVSFLAFFGTMFITGALWQAVVVSKSEDGEKFGTLLLVMAFVGLILAAASAPLGVPVVSADMKPATVLGPASFVASKLALRMVLTGLGVGILALTLVRATQNCRKCAYAPLLAFILALTGELLGRSMFYFAYARIGM